MITKIIPITDFIRKFGEYAELLPKIDKLILTREGRPFAELKSTPQERNKRLLSLAGRWKNTPLASSEYWKKVLVRRNRKEIVEIP